MKNNQKGFANLVLIGIVTLLVIGGGYFILSGKSKEPEIKEISSTDTSNSTDWETYINEEYGFEFDYPSIYTVKSYNEPTVRGHLFGVGISSIAMGEVEGGYGPLSNIGIYVWDNSKKLSLVDWASDEYNNSFSNYSGSNDLKNETISGHKAINYSWEGLGYGKTVLIENNKMILMLDTGANSKTNQGWQDFEGILSTFKFTK